MTITNKIVSLSNKFKMPSPEDIIAIGEIRKTAVIREKACNCACCGKDFKANGSIDYFFTKQGIEFICPSCKHEYEDDWTVTELLSITPSGGPYDVFGGSAKVKMKSGREADVAYRAPNSSSGVGEIPAVFFKSFAPYKEKYDKELAARKCVDVQVQDNWEAQNITATFGSGKKTTIRFKAGTNNSLLFNPDDIKRLSKKEMAEINRELREKQLNQYLISGDK